MPLLEIREYPDPVLRKKALPVETIDDGFQRLIDDMIDTMYAAPGIGLAAPQVGVLRRLIVVDASAGETPLPLYVLINPEVVSREGEQVGEEGCLSLPELNSDVARAARGTVRALDRTGTPVTVEAEGLLARCFQHEIDHLDGVLFMDKISPLKRELYKRRVRKALKVGGGD
ncbi:MAG: peptide deformylase [Nitrospirae bacterium]|nr:peptide deformylase [Nitrospirota bacterium]